ncbi:MAG: hypothetical protein A2V90_04410 [Gammaproteobacteria bacterium RBG_16_57_12]|nr:MAG: hypothetical protein A2V90_04410 [Gammaproteobacteria bacterium RBG_16_57_12]
MKTVNSLIVVCIGLMLTGCTIVTGNSEASYPGDPDLGITLPDTRSAYLGLATPNYADAPAQLPQIYITIGKHAEIIAHHLDNGVPWQEALDGKYLYHPYVEEDLSARLRYRQAGQKLVLSLSPLAPDHINLAGHWGENPHMALDAQWSNKPFNHPDVVNAYVNYTRDLINRFHPDYLSYASDVTELAKTDRVKFNTLLIFLNQVYHRLKLEHPRLPIFITVPLDDAQDFNLNRWAIDMINPYTDYLAISSYPSSDPAIMGQGGQVPPHWFVKLRDLAGKKPIAINGTGFNADAVPTDRGVLPGNERSQADYLHFLLTEADKLNAVFVIWSPVIDLREPPTIDPQDLQADVRYQRLRSGGLFALSMKPRLALRVWDKWLELPPR